MKYEINVKSGRDVRVTLNVRYHGKTYTESKWVSDIVKDDNYDEKLEKRMTKALGKKAYKKFMKRLDKDFDI